MARKKKKTKVVKKKTTKKRKTKKGFGSDLNRTECGALMRAIYDAQEKGDNKLARELHGISRKHTCGLKG